MCVSGESMSGECVSGECVINPLDNAPTAPPLVSLYHCVRVQCVCVCESGECASGMCMSSECVSV